MNKSQPPGTGSHARPAVRFFGMAFPHTAPNRAQPHNRQISNGGSARTPKQKSQEIERICHARRIPAFRVSRLGNLCTIAQSCTNAAPKLVQYTSTTLTKESYLQEIGFVPQNNRGLFSCRRASLSVSTKNRAVPRPQARPPAQREAPSPHRLHFVLRL